MSLNWIFFLLTSAILSVICFHRHIMHTTRQNFRMWGQNYCLRETLAKFPYLIYIKHTVPFPSEHYIEHKSWNQQECRTIMQKQTERSLFRGTFHGMFCYFRSVWCSLIQWGNKEGKKEPLFLVLFWIFFQFSEICWNPGLFEKEKRFEKISFSSIIIPNRAQFCLFWHYGFKMK